MVQALLARRPRVYYGWWIVLAATASTFLHGSLFLYGTSAFFTPLREEFGWSRTEISAAVSLATLAGGLSGPLAGYLIDRWGPRIMELYATLSLALGFLLLAWTSSLPALYALFFLLLGTGYTIGGIGLAPTAAVAYWFVRRRSVAMGIAATGWGPGGLVMPLLLVGAIGAFGWRAAAFGAGLGVLFLGVPISLLLRSRPERYGLQPDGDPPASAEPSQTAAAATSVEPEASLRQALATGTFWLLTLLFTLGYMVTPAIALHQLPFLVETGRDPAAAAAILGAMTLASVPARLLFGVLGDRYDKRLLIVLALLLQSAGLVILVASSELWHLLLYTVVFGTGFGALRPLTPSLQADYFGRRAYGSIRGVSSSLQTVGTMAAPLLTGWVADVFASYRLAFLILALLNASGVLCAALLPRPGAHPPRSGGRSA